MRSVETSKDEQLKATKRGHRALKVGTTSAAMAALIAVTGQAQAQTDIFNTHLEGAIVLGITADGSVRVRLIDGSIIMLRPGTFSLQDDKVYVEAEVAAAIQTSTIDSATANSNSIDDLPVFTSSNQVEAQEGQEFLVNVDANIAGDSSGLTYSIVGGSAAASLNIDPVTGVITVKPGATLQTGNGGTQQVVVRVTNADGDFAEQSISIAGPSAPVASNGLGSFNPLVLGGGAAGALGLASMGGGSDSTPASGPNFSSSTATASIEENGTVVTGYQASAGAGSSYRITNVVDNTGLNLTVNDFAISGSGNIALTGGQVIDLESLTDDHFTLTIKATADGKTSTQTVTLNIIDLDEFDVAFTSASPVLALGINENFEGALAGYSAAAEDADATDDVTFSITDVSYVTSSNATGLTAADFAISSDGTISVVKAGGLNFETLDENFVLTVTARSADGSVDTQAVEIGVQNMNDAPVFSPDSVNIMVDETQATDLYQVIALDEDNANTTVDTLFYEIFAGNDDGIFTIDSATGHISFVDPVNEDNDGAYNLSIRATDNNGAGDPAGTLFSVLSLGILVNEIA